MRASERAAASKRDDFRSVERIDMALEPRTNKTAGIAPIAPRPRLHNRRILGAR